MADTPAPDPDLVAKLTAMHIEDPDIVAGILARNGLTLCETDPDNDEGTD